MADAIDKLFCAVLRARQPGTSALRTEKLLREGITKMAKKLAEEAVEVGLDAVQGNRPEVISESADLLYNLCVLWSAAGVTPDDVWGEMDRRERMMGIAEKLPKASAKLQIVNRLSTAR